LLRQFFVQQLPIGAVGGGVGEIKSARAFSQCATEQQVQQLLQVQHCFVTLAGQDWQADGG
jgi:hypothetical protein